jgi:hypothetical protein
VTRAFPSGPTKRISVDRLAIQTNPAESPRLPVLLLACGDMVVPGWQADVRGPSRLVYSALHPQRHDGSHVWLETEAAVELTTEYERPAEPFPYASRPEWIDHVGSGEP